MIGGVDPFRNKTPVSAVFVNESLEISQVLFFVEETNLTNGNDYNTVRFPPVGIKQSTESAKN